MRKKEIYTPLFEVEDSDIERSKCSCCGKYVKKSLLNTEDICIECVMNNKITSTNFSFPNKKLFESFLQQYKQYLKTRPKNHTPIFLFGAVGFLGATAVNMVAESMQPHDPNSDFGYINKKINTSTFDKCNKMTITIKDESWVCPCCNHDNSGAHFCTICGVYPKFKLED